jgi:hypothetical protein
MRVIKYPHGSITYWVYKIFLLVIEILIALHLKDFSFWPSADVKPMLNDLAHAMIWQYMFALSL